MDLEIELDDHERAALEAVAARQQRSADEIGRSALREYLANDHRERVDPAAQECVERYGDALRRLGEGPR